MTATEIVSAKQRLFSTVKEVQNSVENALEELLDVMNYWADFLPGVPAGGYRSDYQWDDSVLIDTTAEKNAVFTGNCCWSAAALGISSALFRGNKRTGKGGVRYIGYGGN